MGGPESLHSDSLFGKLVVEQGLASAAQVDECLSMLRKLAEGGVTPLPRLADLLIRKGYLSARQYEATLHASKHPSSAGGTSAREAPLPADAAEAAGDAANLFGKYVRARRLGAGGMGEVWRAWDRELRRWVALKLLRGRDAGEIARFEREAQTAAKLAHPNIAAVHDVGERDGQPFIAMQLVEGQTLVTFPRDDRRALVGVMREAALAVHFAHEHGVIHRDLKPANIMVEGNPGGRPKTTRRESGREAPSNLRVFVMDFGLAKQSAVDSSLSVAGSVLGTPAYMPPEQARGQLAEVDARSDVYSLGATLYELLADRPPFQAGDVYAILRKVIDEDPPPLRRVNPRADPDLETIVMKCLEKEPARRYASALELAEDLGRWRDGETILAHPPSLAYRLRKFVGRRKGVVAMAGAGVAALLLSLVILVPKWLGEKAEAERQARARVAENEAAAAREKALKELGSLWAEAVVVKEWMRQPFRKPEEIRRELDRAIAKTTDYIVRHPDHPQGFYVRAREKLYLGDLEGSERDLHEALRIEPAFSPGWALLAKVNLDRHAQMRYSADEADRPEHEARGRAYLARAQEALERGWAKGAERMAVETWGLSRTREDEVNDTLGRAFREFHLKRDEHAAVEILRKAQEGAPSEEYCRLLAFWSTRPQESAAWRDLAVRIAPHFASGYFDRGCVRADSGDVRGAIEDFARVIEIEPRHVQALENRGVAWGHRGRFKDAIDDFTRAIDADPTLATAYANRGAARQDSGDPEGALADYEKAIELNPRAANAYYNRGVLRQETNRQDQAIEDFNRTIEINPKFAEAWCNRGISRAMKGDRDAAIPDFNRAVELKPVYPKAYYNRGYARLQDKERKRAIEDFNRAIEQDSRYFEAYANRGLAKAIEKDYDGAIADFEKCLECAPADWGHRNAVKSWLDMARSDKKN